MSTNIQTDQLRFMLAMQQNPGSFTKLGEMTKEQQGEFQRALKLCYKLIEEETVIELLPALDSYITSPTDTSLADIYDGLVDSVYVLMQLANTLGLDFYAGWKEVQKTNMAKRQGSVILKNAFGKVVKPAGWKPPDFAQLVADHYGKAEQSLETGDGNE